MDEGRMDETHRDLRCDKFKENPLKVRLGIFDVDVGVAMWYPRYPNVRTFDHPCRVNDLG